MKKNQKGISLVALIVTVIVLIILTGVIINTFNKKNGIVKNTNYAKTANAYYEAEQQVKMAHTAVLVEVTHQREFDDNYNPTTLAETQRLATIVQNSLEKKQSDDNWNVDGSSSGIITITYTNKRIAKGVIESNIPREVGMVHYKISLFQNKEPALDIDIGE